MQGRLFLIGCPRSGTTLLQSLVASHPCITSFPESHYFWKAEAKWRICRKMGLASSEARSLLRTYFREIEAEEHLRRVEPWHMVSVRACVRTFVRGLDAVAEKRGVSVWLEKTPEHLHYVEEIQRYVPKGQCIHIVRRGEDVVASLFDVTQRHPEEWEGARDVETCLRRWQEDVDRTLQYSSRPNHVVVHYDDLVEKTESVLRCICEHVGVRYDPKMIRDYRETAEQVQTDDEEWKRRNKEEISPSSKFDRVIEGEKKRVVEEGVRERNELIQRFKLDEG